MGKMTSHGKFRVKERVKPDRRKLALLRSVMLHGKSPETYKGTFYQYLSNKEKRGAKVKVYKDTIYIVSKNTHRLITTYKVPQKYLPTSKYEIDKAILSLLVKIDYIGNLPLIISLKNGDKVFGYVISRTNQYLIVVSNGSEKCKVMLEDVDDIDLDKELINSTL